MEHGILSLHYIDVLGDAIDPVNETPVLKGVHIINDEAAKNRKTDDSGYPYKKFDQKK